MITAAAAVLLLGLGACTGADIELHSRGTAFGIEYSTAMPSLGACSQHSQCNRFAKM